MSARFARQISLAEIGTTGQAKIQASAVRAGRGDARALEVALDYLERAGAPLCESGRPLDVAETAVIEALAGRPELVEAAAFLAGSLAATERLAEAVGLEARVACWPSLFGGEP